MVPSNPGFPSCSCRISTTSSAYLPSPRHSRSYSSYPTGGLVTALHVNRVYLRYRSSRFRVAQQHFFDWVEGGMSATSARCSLASQYYPAQSYGGFRRLGVSSREVSPCVCILQLAVCLLCPCASAKTYQADHLSKIHRIFRRDFFVPMLV